MSLSCSRILRSRDSAPHGKGQVDGVHVAFPRRVQELRQVAATHAQALGNRRQPAVGTIVVESGELQSHLGRGLDAADQLEPKLVHAHHGKPPHVIAPGPNRSQDGPQRHPRDRHHHGPRHAPGQQQPQGKIMGITGQGPRGKQQRAGQHPSEQRAEDLPLGGDGPPTAVHAVGLGHQVVGHDRRRRRRDVGLAGPRSWSSGPQWPGRLQSKRHRQRDRPDPAPTRLGRFVDATAP